MQALQATYILPIKTADVGTLAELAAYVNGLPVEDVIVADASTPAIFATLDALLRTGVRHVRPDASLAGLNGKVRNVLTALSAAQCESVIVADDDVRYDRTALAQILGLLQCAHVVRPQNYFTPVPWHALLDTARILINRALDGDWPGTLAFRRSALPRGYNADVLFENFELVRTIKARGGREIVARNVYVARRPPKTGHFFSQRVRQAYDEFARPLRLAAALAIAPGIALSLALRLWYVPCVLAGVSVIVAAYGRARDGGAQYFPALGVAAAPVWMIERAICAWLAVYERFRYGGVRYAGGILRDACSPPEVFARWTA